MWFASIHIYEFEALIEISLHKLIKRRNGIHLTNIDLGQMGPLFDKALLLQLGSSIL